MKLLIINLVSFLCSSDSLPLDIAKSMTTFFEKTFLCSDYEIPDSYFSLTSLTESDFYPFSTNFNR